MHSVRIAILVALVAAVAASRPDSFLVLPHQQGEVGKGPADVSRTDAIQQLLQEHGFFVEFQQEIGDAPWFCHGIDCPEFEVDETFTAVEGVERRVYSSTKWASVHVKGVGYDKAMYDGFMALFRYISGTNEDSVKIPMTAPVRTKNVPAAGPTCEDDFVISFFVPFEFQESTPAPTEEGVVLTDEEPFVVYVSTYGGFSGEKSVISHAAELSAVLVEAGVDIVSDYYYSAGYDPPFRLLKRHNEVWIVEEGSSAGEELAGLRTLHEGNTGTKFMGEDAEEAYYYYYDYEESGEMPSMFDEYSQYDNMYYGDIGYYEEAGDIYDPENETYYDYELNAAVSLDGDYVDAVWEFDGYAGDEMEEFVHALEEFAG